MLNKESNIQPKLSDVSEVFDWSAFEKASALLPPIQLTVMLQMLKQNNTQEKSRVLSALFDWSAMAMFAAPESPI